MLFPLSRAVAVAVFAIIFSTREVNGSECDDLLTESECNERGCLWKHQNDGTSWCQQKTVVNGVWALLGIGGVACCICCICRERCQNRERLQRAQNTASADPSVNLQPAPISPYSTDLCGLLCLSNICCHCYKRSQRRKKLKRAQNVIFAGPSVNIQPVPNTVPRIVYIVQPLYTPNNQANNILQVSNNPPPSYQDAGASAQPPPPPYEYGGAPTQLPTPGY